MQECSGIGVAKGVGGAFCRRGMMCTPESCPDVATAEWDGALKVGWEAAKVIGPCWDTVWRGDLEAVP